jgi:hypothetical protein
VETRGGDRATIGTLAHRDIDIPVDRRLVLAIGKSEFLRSKELGHHKSRNPEKSGPSIRGGRVAAIGAIGESPDRKSLIGVWVIGISGILVTRCLGISESRSRNPERGKPCGASCQHIREEESAIVRGQLSA